MNIVRAGSNLLDAKNEEAWADLSPVHRMKVAGSLVQAMQDNAKLLAGVTHQPQVLMESSYNICEFFVLSCLVLSCLVLSCLVLSCLVLSCIVL